MYKRYYDGYGSQRANGANKEIAAPHGESSTYVPDSAVQSYEEDNIGITSNHGGFLGSSLDTDDLILIGVLIFLMSGDGEIDPVLIILIGFVLFSELL